MKKIIILILFLIPIQSYSDEGRYLLSCSFGKVVLGQVVPFTEPEYKLPKIWQLIEAGYSSNNDKDGEFEPVNYGETETDFYKNYYSDDIVNMTDAKGKIHKYINQAGFKWRYFDIKLNRLNGKVVVDVRNVPDGEIYQGWTNKFPIISTFEGVCKKINKKL